MALKIGWSNHFRKIRGKILKNGVKLIIFQRLKPIICQIIFGNKLISLGSFLKLRNMALEWVNPLEKTKLWPKKIQNFQKLEYLEASARLFYGFWEQIFPNF